MNRGHLALLVIMLGASPLPARAAGLDLAAYRMVELMRTGWARFWPDRKAYLGDDTPNDASRLSFPSFGEDAARLLVEERRVGGSGGPLRAVALVPKR